VLSLLQLLLTADVPSPLIIFTVMLETISYSETPVLTIATQRHIPEDDIVHTVKLNRQILYNFPGRFLIAWVTVSVSSGS
jgi:hypothetical protein